MKPFPGAVVRRIREGQGRDERTAKAAKEACMQPVEIVLIIACALIVAGVAVSAVVRKKRGKTGCGCDCADCGHCSACRGGKEKSPGGK